MEDLFSLPFEEWIQQPQVIIGLVMAGITPLAMPALVRSEFCLNSCSSHGWHKDRTYNMEVVRTTGLLWEGSCLFLLVYGCVKYTTAWAMVGVFIYSFVRSMAMIAVTYVLARKRMAQGVTEDTPLEPVSVYTDIEAGTFLKCLSVFVLQMLLYVLLLRWIASKSFIEEDATDEERARYAAGSIVATVQRTMSQGFRSGELEAFWMTYFFGCEGKYRRPYHYPKMRLVMSWIVNDLLSTSVFLLLPLVTMGSDNDMEFVKDCTAVLFISQLDSFEADLGEGHFLHPDTGNRDINPDSESSDAASPKAAATDVGGDALEQSKPVQL